MAMDVGGARGGVKSDINVTPLVDVMLVLLIIMMLIAPMLQQGAPVNKPEAANGVDKPDTQDQTVVAVDSRGHFYVNAIPVADPVARRVREVELGGSSPSSFSRPCGLRSVPAAARVARLRDPRM